MNVSWNKAEMAACQIFLVISLTWFGLLIVFCKIHVLSRDTGKLERALMWHFGLLRQLACATGIKHMVGEVSLGRDGWYSLVRPLLYSLLLCHLQFFCGRWGIVLTQVAYTTQIISGHFLSLPKSTHQYLWLNFILCIFEFNAALHFFKIFKLTIQVRRESVIPKPSRNRLRIPFFPTL